MYVLCLNFDGKVYKWSLIRWKKCNELDLFAWKNVSNHTNDIRLGIKRKVFDEAVYTCFIRPWCIWIHLKKQEIVSAHSIIKAASVAFVFACICPLISIVQPVSCFSCFGRHLSDTAIEHYSTLSRLFQKSHNTKRFANWSKTTFPPGCQNILLTVVLIE